MMRNRWYLPVTVVLYVLIAGMYSTWVPLFEAPDEVWHYGYAYWLAGGNGLPVPDRGSDSDMAWPYGHKKAASRRCIT